MTITTREVSAQIYGGTAQEIEAVGKGIVKELSRASRVDRPNVWVSGSFWLSLLVIVVLLLLAITHFVPVWLFLAVVAAAILLIYVVGSLVLFHQGVLKKLDFMAITRAILHKIGPLNSWIDKKST
jgi:hypothetical protein